MAPFTRNFFTLKRLLPGSQAVVNEVEERLNLVAEMLGPSLNNQVRLVLLDQTGIDVSVDPTFIAAHTIPRSGTFIVPILVVVQRSVNSLTADISLTLSVPAFPPLVQDEWGTWGAQASITSVVRKAGSGSLATVDFSNEAFPVPAGNGWGITFHSGIALAIGRVLFVALEVPGELMSLPHFKR